MKEQNEAAWRVPFRPVRYPMAHGWSVLLAALDLTLTSVILQLGGRELNVLAEVVIGRFGLAGATAYKFALISFVICLCEIVGRRDVHAGRRFCVAVIAIASTPVVVAAAQLLARWWAVPPATSV